MKVQDKEDQQKLASKVFDNSDFGYYKVNIERPKRLKAQLRDDLIATLRYDKSLIEPMSWAYNEFGREVYEDISKHEKQLLEWCDKQEINLKAKQKKSLVSQVLWKKHEKNLNLANTFQKHIGTKVYDDFNLFKTEIEKTIKQQKIKPTSSEKNQILNAVSWYDEKANQVIKKVHLLNKEKLKTLLKHLGCKENKLNDFGYYKIEKNSTIYRI